MRSVRAVRLAAHTTNAAGLRAEFTARQRSEEGLGDLQDAPNERYLLLCATVVHPPEIFTVRKTCTSPVGAGLPAKGPEQAIEKFQEFNNGHTWQARVVEFERRAWGGLLNAKDIVRAPL